MMGIYSVDMLWRAVLVITSLGLRQCIPTDLYLLGLIPLKGHWPSGESVKIGANVALEEINNRNDVLPGYRLNILWNDTQCDPVIGVEMMIKRLLSKPTVLMIYGTGCPDVGVAVARSSHYLNLVQMSWGSGSPVLSDKSKYPRFFRGIGADSSVNQPRIELFRKFNWNAIAMMHQDFSIFSETVNDLIKKLIENNMTVIRSELVFDHPRRQIEILKNHDARVIVGLFYEALTRTVMCEAYKIGLYGPKIVWILVDFLDTNWQQVKPEENLTCTSEQIREAAGGYFTIARLTFSRKPFVTVGGLSVKELIKLFKSKTNGMQHFGLLRSAPLSYDAVWCIALALNATQARLAKTGKTRLEDFNYIKNEISNIIVQEMKKINFNGIKGNIHFDKNQGQTTPIVVMHNEGGKMQIIANYDESLEELKWLTKVKWKDGSPPNDAVKIKLEEERLSVWVYIVMCFLSGLGMCQSILFLAFNIYYIEEKIVKMSSPRINNCTLFGCLIIFIVPFLEHFISKNIAALCQTRIILLVLGMSLVFGALFSKTWRVYSVFTTIRVKRKRITDTQLLCMVAFLIGINLVVLFTWFSMDDITVIHSIKEIKTDVDKDITLNKVVFCCVSNHQHHFTGILIAIQASILMLGAFLAFQTRKVQVVGLNDSKLIAMCIYHVLVLSGLGITITLELKNEPDIWYGLTSGILIIATTITQSLIVIPKMIALWSNKVGDFDPRRRTTLATIVAAQRIFNLETVVSQKNNLIQELESKVNDYSTLLVSTGTQTME